MLTALRHPPFVACVIVLVAATVCTGPVAKWMKIVLRKEPVPLRKRLAELDKTALGEYEFKRANTIDQAVVDTLGTDLYIDWEFIDTSVTGTKNPLRRVHLFVTYYTGKPDLVPHTPDVCYRGAGYEIKDRDNRTLVLDEPGGDTLRVPIRAVTFEKSDVYYRDRFTVIYTFHCNGSFVNTRTDVRRRLANPFDKGAYYCKVELGFGRQGSRHQKTIGREEAIRAAQKFLDRLLPVLLEDHLPDWDAVQQGQLAQS
jgi:hypothetical protein